MTYTKIEQKIDDSTTLVELKNFIEGACAFAPASSKVSLEYCNGMEDYPSGKIVVKWDSSIIPSGSSK